MTKTHVKMMTNVMDKEHAAFIIIVKELHDHLRVETTNLMKLIQKIGAINNLELVNINVMGPEHVHNMDGAKEYLYDIYPQNY